MAIALAVRDRADCIGQKVGAVVVVENRIVSTGYNGTPSKMVNCSMVDAFDALTEQRSFSLEQGTISASKVTG